MKPKISVITLGVLDFERSLRFYRDGLGFPTHNYKENEEFAFFKLEGTWLAIYPRKKLAEDAMTSAEGSGFSAITLAHNAVNKEEVDKVVTKALSAGAKLVKQPQEAFWGGYSGYFADPDGHLWEVAFNPSTDLT
jgi:uncharacterized protein